MGRTVFKAQLMNIAGGTRWRPPRHQRVKWIGQNAYDERESISNAATSEGGTECAQRMIS